MNSLLPDESLDKGVKEVRNQGQDEETTTIKVYKVNEQTGDLTEPDVTTKVAKPMQAKNNGSRELSLRLK